MPPEFWILPSCLPIHPGLVYLHLEIATSFNNFGLTYLNENLQQKCGVTAGWFTCQCLIYTGRDSLVQ